MYHWRFRHRGSYTLGTAQGPDLRHKLCLCVLNHQAHNCVTVDLNFLITHGFAHQLRNFLHVIKVTAELKRNAVSSFFKLLGVSDCLLYTSPSPRD